MSLSIGAWALPVIVTILAFTWAVPMRADERPNGSMFSGMGYMIGGGFRTLSAAIVSLIAWLIWALAS